MAKIQGSVGSVQGIYDPAGNLLGFSNPSQPGDGVDSIAALLSIDSNNNVTGITNPKGGIVYSTILQKRFDRSKSWISGPLNVAPAWSAGATIVLGDIRKITNGKTLVCGVAGTTGTIEPSLNGIATITASVATTTTLTVTAISGDPIGIGTEIMTGGVTAGTRISAYLTGTGGAGTYTISGNSVVTVASASMSTITNPSGRAITDNTVTWYEDTIVKSTSDVLAPKITYEGSYATADAALNFTRYLLDPPNTWIPGNPIAYLTPKCGVGTVSPYKAIGIDYRKNATSGSYDSIAAALGYPVGMSKSAGFEFEFYISDVAFGVEYNTATYAGYYVEVDGVPLEGNPTKTNNTSGQVIKYDFKGEYKRRRVVLKSVQEEVLSALHISPIGILESGVASTDTLLCLGDSFWDTASTPTTGPGMYTVMGQLIKNSLGFDGVCVANAGGSGYIATSGNFTMNQLITDVTNQTLFTSYNVSHVIICAGFNDISNTANAVSAAALLMWKNLRTLLPNAKITIFDNWNLRSGGNAVAIANALKATFSAWNDGNSRFVSFNGLNAATPLVNGVGNITSTVFTSANGSSQLLIGSDTTHPSLAGVKFYAEYIISSIKNAWNNQY